MGGRAARLPGVGDARASRGCWTSRGSSGRGTRSSSRRFSRIAARPRRPRPRGSAAARVTRSRDGAALRLARRRSPSGPRSARRPGSIASSSTCPTFSFLRAPSRLGLSSCCASRSSRRSRCGGCSTRACRRRRRAGRGDRRRARDRGCLGDLHSRGTARAGLAVAGYAHARAQSARAARRVPVLRRAHRLSAARAVHAVLDRALDAAGQRLQRRDPGRLPRGRAGARLFPSNDAFAVLARRRVRYIAVHWDMYVGTARTRSAAG